ncbi:MAG: Gfo/Idh/MocA family oxidoreductase [Planctomycetes bacterium]|nr:Gfo/Idh/MocA family oxidoreductase [Planctomycetota bacterium]
MSLGLAVLGGGRVVGAHAGIPAHFPQLRLVGIAEPNRERHAPLAQQFGCPIFESSEELIRRDDVHIVAVCLPHHLHHPMALRALESGKHVMIEKPMALNASQCDEILAAQRRAGVKLAIGHHHNFVPANVEARRLIQSGQIGRLVFATDSWFKPFHEGVRPPWFLDRECGGGMWWMNGPHHVDRLRRIIGSRIVSVKAKVSSDIYGYSAADSGMAMLQFENGVYATITHAGYRFGTYHFTAEFTASHGILRLLDERLFLCRGKEFEAVETKGEAVHLAQWRDFLEAIETGRQPFVNGEYGREIVAACEAAERSSELGREVLMKELGEYPCSSAHQR